MAFMTKNTGHFLRCFLARYGVAAFPHINISPHQMFLTQSHATYNACGDGNGFFTLLGTNVAVHINPSSYGFCPLAILVPDIDRRCGTVLAYPRRCSRIVLIQRNDVCHHGCCHRFACEQAWIIGQPH